MSRPIGVLKRLSIPDPDLALPVVLDRLDSIVRSVEPAVVFSSVAQLCVPALADHASIAISEGGEQNYLIAQPVEQAGADEVGGGVAFGGIKVTDDAAVIDFVGDAVDDVYPAYQGVLVLQVADPAPADALLGQLIVDRAVAIIGNERLAAVAEAQQGRADNLERAMHTSREIGIAMGIIMSRHKLTSEQAFDVLRLVSQSTNRKVRDLALDVMETGDVELPAHVAPGPASVGVKR